MWGRTSHVVPSVQAQQIASVAASLLMCHEHQPVPLLGPLRKREATIRLSLSMPVSMNREIEEWRLLTGNDKAEILRQIIRQWLNDHPLPVVV